MIILVVCFCKWYLKSYFCICSCLLWHKSTAPLPTQTSFLTRSPLHRFLFFLNFFFFSFLKHTTEMNVLFSTRSISLFFLLCFLLTSHPVFALIFLHSCLSFRLFPFFLRKAVISNTCVPTHNRIDCLFNFIDSLIIRYPHFSVYFHSTPHTCTRLDLSKEPTCAFKREPACPHSPFPSALQSSLAAWT